MCCSLDLNIKRFNLCANKSTVLFTLYGQGHDFGQIYFLIFIVYNALVMD